MPSPAPMAAQRRGTMVRQLSLQGTTPPIAMVRRGLRRQLSDDVSDKMFVDLHIGASLSHEKNKVNSCDQSPKSVKPATRPKHVRLAWADRRQDSAESDPGVGVEVVARRCTGLQRPASRPSHVPSLSQSNKEPLAFTRQQLAERLRRAWRDRERKPDLDIFLAHGRPESRPVSERSAVNEDSDTNSATNMASKPIRAVHYVQTPSTASPEYLQERNKLEIDLGMENTEPKKTTTYADILNFKMFPEADVSVRYGQDFGSRQFQMRNISFTRQTSFNKENIETNAEESFSTTRDSVSTSERRASFKSSHLLNKTITGSFSDSPDNFSGIHVQVSLTEMPSRPPLTRTSSVPSHKLSRPSSPANKRTSNNTLKAVEKRPILTSATNKQAELVESDSQLTREKLAAARRKLKTAASRRKNKDREESSDEDEKSELGKKKSWRRQLPKGNIGSDIITMVSLVSPAESDVEESPPLSLPSNDVPTSSEQSPPKKVEEHPKEAQPLIVQSGISLRKTPKTVSFQAHPPISRSTSATLPLRRPPIIVQPPNSSSPTYRITESQENSLIHDNRGIKRRLVHSKTLPLRDDEDNVSSDDTCRTDISSEPVSAAEAEKNIDLGHEAQPEPEIKSSKEKECWLLYKKMMDKGVAVSYETVLRGMLTPTEYRLRRNQLSRS